MGSLSFTELARSDHPPLDRLALALASDLRPETDAAGALAALDALGDEVSDTLAGHERTPAAELAAVTEVLGSRHGFHGVERDYDHPDRSMLDLVLERRVGLPILLSVVYAEVARRAGARLAGVGLAGHFVVGHFGASPPLLADPFHRGRRLPDALARPSCTRGGRARRRCGCSTTSCPPTSDATTSGGPSGPPSCASPSPARTARRSSSSSADCAPG